MTLTRNVTPKYAATAAAIRAQIRSGRLQPGEQLPTERQLAQEHGVALLTLRQALQILADEGLISREHGRGTFVSDSAAPSAPPAASGSVGQHATLIGLRATPAADDNPANWEGLFRRYQGIVECGYQLGLPVHAAPSEWGELTIDELREKLGATAGLIIHDHALPVPTAEALHAAGIPVVAITHTDDTVSFPQVQIDVRSGAAAAVRHLVDLGHTRIATVVGDLSSPWNRLRLEGYCSELDQSGVQRDGDLIIHDGKGTVAEGAGYLKKILAMEPRPTAVFCTDTRAIGILQALGEHGLSCPADLAIIGYNDLSLAAKHGLTTIHNPLYESGAAAAQLLHALVDGSLSAESPVVLTPHLVRRQTCGESSGCGIRDTE